MIRPTYVAGYVVYEQKFLLLRRCKTTHFAGIWQIVTGKLDPDETAPQAVLREISEESGLACKTLYNVDATLFYDPFTKGISVSANFCALVQSEHVTLSKEHDGFCWCTPEEAREKLAFPAQKETLSFIHQHFVLNEPHPVSRLDINETNLLA